MVCGIGCTGRLGWLHCWTVTVISVDVPSAVIFVSFGASLVYAGIGTVVWEAGAFLVLLSYILSILSGLLFMKLAQLIEVGINQIEEGRPTGPISVIIGEDGLKEKSDSFEVGYQSSGYAGA